MTQPPDKLFHEGLEHYSKPAPSSAWERIESGLDHKRKRSQWMKIASGLLLLIATSTILFQLNQEDILKITVAESAAKKEQESDISFRETSDVSRQDVIDRESSDVNGKNPITSLESSDMSREVIVNRESSAVRGKKPIASRESSNVSLEVLNGHMAFAAKSVTPDESTQAAIPDQTETRIESTPVAQAELTNKISNPVATSDFKGTSITYSAEEVNARFLKKESAPEATPEKKNTSGFQKVIDMAIELKNEGNVIGELREKKNELLSFNMPSKRETNK